MPNNKKYNLKDIKNKDGIHPYSRKAQQMARAVTRQNKLEKRKGKVLTGIQALKADRFSWFKYALDDETKFLTIPEIRELIEDYLVREIVDTDVSKPLSFKQDVLKIQHQKEREEFINNGLEIPDLTKIATVKLLRDWDGDWNGITSIKVIRVRPPKVSAE